MIEGDPIVVQASAVAISGRALLIEGPPGSGKSSLALALIDRGAGLIGDDAVSLTRVGETLMAGPPPNISGLIEIRGVGLISLRPASSAPLALMLTLGEPEGDRLPEAPERRVIAGLAIPVLRFVPGAIAPAARAEWALRCHGLASGSSDPA
jgi:HPr kinase/phosphorylase